MRIKSILSWTHLITNITLITVATLHMLGLNMVCDVVTLPGLVVADETKERVRGQFLHVLLQGGLHVIIVSNT